MHNWQCSDTVEKVIHLKCMKRFCIREAIEMHQYLGSFRLSFHKLKIPDSFVLQFFLLLLGRKLYPSLLVEPTIYKNACNKNT